MGGICIICLRKREGKVRENLHKASTSSACLTKRIQTTTKPQTTSKPHTTSHHSTRHQYASKTSIPFTREDPETPPPPPTQPSLRRAALNAHRRPRITRTSSLAEKSIRVSRAVGASERAGDLLPGRVSGIRNLAHSHSRALLIRLKKEAGLWKFPKRLCMSVSESVLLLIVLTVFSRLYLGTLYRLNACIYACLYKE